MHPSIFGTVHPHYSSTENEDRAGATDAVLREETTAKLILTSQL